MNLNSKNWTHFKIGILGGGQLARMLTEAGNRMGLNMYVLSQSSSDPAAKVCSNWVKGSPDSLTDLKRFMAKMDLVTFESEFFDGERIAKASKSSKTKVQPSPSLVEKLQDRWPQKKLFEKFNLETSPFMLCASKFSYHDYQQKLGPKFVLKSRRFGYDGYGTRVIKSERDFKAYYKKHRFDDQWIAESLIPFKRELAVQIARNKAGEFAFLPLCETHQTHSQCDWVKGPISVKAWNSIKNRIKTFMNSLNYSGVLAFEFFDYNGKLIVNEIAPRVHNSGHHSQDSLSLDQFELHLLGICNQKLRTPKLNSQGFAMVNLLGQSKKQPQIQIVDGTHLHWYGKSQNRPHRKMGHINAIGTSADKALKVALKARKEQSL